MDDVVALLGRTRRRWWARALLSGVGWSATAASAVFIAWIPYVRFLAPGAPSEVALATAAAVGVIGLILTVVGSWIRRPSLSKIATWADRRFGLADRISAGLEVRARGAVTRVDRALYGDVVAHAAKIEPRVLVSLHVRRTALLLCVPIALSVASRMLPATTSVQETRPAAAQWLTEREAEEARVTVRRIALLVDEEAEARNDSALAELARSFERVSEQLAAGDVNRVAYEGEVERILAQVGDSFELSTALGLRTGDGAGDAPAGETNTSRSPATLDPGEDAPVDWGGRPEPLERVRGPGQDELTLDSLLDRLETQALARAKPKAGANLDDVRFRSGEGELAPGDYFDNPALRAANEQIRRNIERQRAASAQPPEVVFNGPGAEGDEAGTAATPLDQGVRGRALANDPDEAQEMLLPATGRSTGRRLELHAPTTGERGESSGTVVAEPGAWRRTEEVRQADHSLPHDHHDVLARYFLPRTALSTTSPVTEAPNQ